MSDREVISIGEAALRRAVQRAAFPAPSVVELSRAQVGKRILVAKRAHVRGRNV